MNSPRRVPPPRRANTQGQLLDELEALSQALYQAQAQQKAFVEQQGDIQPRVQEKDSSPASAKKPFSRRETLPARRFSSYEPSKDVSATPLPGFASSLSTPVPSSNPASRHSISTPQIPDAKPSPVASRPRFTSTTLPSQTLSSWGDDKSDIRSRIERRGSPQLQQIQSPDQYPSEEFDWPDDTPDVSSKLEPSSAEKKKSFWNWKPLRAISHIGRQRFFCVFSAYVHAIKGLPLAMNGLRLAVHMRKAETKEGAVQTIPSRVLQGVAEFEESLYMKCTVYGSKGQSNNIKFMSKAFIVSVVAPDAEELDLGKHQLDLSRLLPENMDEKKGDLERGNSWNTSLELSGKAKGGKLVITFNYEVLDKDLAKSSGLASKFQGSNRRRSSLQTSYSLPNSAHGTPRTRSANAYGSHSPSVSEPGNDFNDDLGMDLLNLDDPLEGAGEAKVPQQAEVQFYPNINSQLGMPAGSSDAYNAFDNFEPRLKNVSQELGRSTPGQFAENDGAERDRRDAELEDYGSENEQEFMVVDQGMEIDEAVKVFRSEEEVRQEEPESEHLEELESELLEEPKIEHLEGKPEREESPLLEPVQEQKKVHEQEEATLGSQDGQKKEPVTYQMVMKTLESLLQGTSAKERAHLEMLEGRAEMEHSGRESGQTALSKQGKKAAVQVRSKESGVVDTKILTVETELPKGSKEEAKQKVVDENLGQEVDEFLYMLESGDGVLERNSDSEPDSPRAQLLKQFEQEALLEGGFGLDLSPSKDSGNNLSVDAGTAAAGNPALSPSSKKPGAAFASSKSMTVVSRKEVGAASPSGAAVSKSFTAAQSFQSKTKDVKEKSLGEVEQGEWGWKEKALPINTPKQLEPQPLGKGLGASVTVKDGGTLRSMNPMLFLSENCSGKLVMQVSKPVVLPAEIGSGTVDILRNMASMGIENMALQAMTAMPLEELMGMSVEQIAMEGLAVGKASRIRGALGAFRLRPTVKEAAKTSQQLSSDNKDAYVSLENLAPMATQQLEYLAMDGLKIQAGMTEEEAPYALNAFSMDGQGGGEDALRRGNTGTLRGITGVHLLKGAKVPAQTIGGGKGLMDMAITLDEWVLLDGGSYSEAENSKDALAIMAAHRAVQDAERQTLDPKSKAPRWGCMGNTLSIAMLVQLRDPLRSYEPIGVPMIAFVQAERVVMPSLPRTSADSQPESLFKITGVHMAGLKASQDNRRPGWGSQRQLRAATRWLLANGMSKPKGIFTSKSKLKQGDCLWSISAQLLGSGNKRKDLMKLNPHVRNPDVLYESHGPLTK